MQTVIVTHDECARAELHHVFRPEVALHCVGAYEAAKPVEAGHLREAIHGLFGREVMLEGDDTLAVLQWQHKVVMGADVKWLEFGGGEVQLLEWKLDVCGRVCCRTCRLP